MGKDQTAATPRAPPTGSLCSGASHGLQRLLRPSHTGDPSCPSLLPPLPSLIAASASQRTRLLLEGHANQGDCRSGPVPWTEPGWSTGQGGRHVRRTTSSEEVMVEMRRGAASHAQSDMTERLSRSDAWKFVSFGQHLPMFPTHLLVATIILSVFVSLPFFLLKPSWDLPALTPPPVASHSCRRQPLPSSALCSWTPRWF